MVTSWPTRSPPARCPSLLTGLIAGLGLAGLLRRGLPERRFLLLSMLAGVLIIATGYVSALGNPLASQLGHLINGPGRRCATCGSSTR